MTGARQTGAEDTAALLVQSERSGSSVLIPGAFEKRAAGLGTSLRSRADADVTEHDPLGASDFERLERAREGGGAPSARAGRRSGTLGARLCQSLLHPMHLPDIWRRVLPQAS